MTRNTLAKYFEAAADLPNIVIRMTHSCVACRASTRSQQGLFPMPIKLLNRLQ